MIQLAERLTTRLGSITYFFSLSCLNVSGFIHPNVPAPFPRCTIPSWCIQLLFPHALRVICRPRNFSTRSSFTNTPRYLARRNSPNTERVMSPSRRARITCSNVQVLTQHCNVWPGGAAIMLSATQPKHPCPGRPPGVLAVLRGHSVQQFRCEAGYGLTFGTK